MTQFYEGEQFVESSSDSSICGAFFVFRNLVLSLLIINSRKAKLNIMSFSIAMYTCQRRINNH